MSLEFKIIISLFVGLLLSVGLYEIWNRHTCVEWGRPYRTTVWVYYGDDLWIPQEHIVRDCIKR